MLKRYQEEYGKFKAGAPLPKDFFHFSFLRKICGTDTILWSIIEIIFKAISDDIVSDTSSMGLTVPTKSRAIIEKRCVFSSLLLFEVGH